MPDDEQKNEESKISFPAEIKFGVLNTRGAEYHEERLLCHKLMYEGGSAFHDHIDKFLVKRQIEKSGTNYRINNKTGKIEGAGAGAGHWEARSEKAWYIPRGAGLIDWLIAEVFKRDIKIVCNNGTEEQKKYWESLNDNVDGLGKSLSALARDVLKEVLLHQRGYFAVKFTDEYGQAASDGSLDARIRSLPAELVDDWEFDPFGRLTLVRTRHEQLVRENVWEQPTKRRYCWSFFTEAQIAEFELEAKIDAAPKDEESVSKVEDFNHDFGEIPIFPIRAQREMWVMERMHDVLMALFNREVSITWALDQLAYSLLILKLDTTQIDKIVAADMAALKLTPQEDAKFESPTPKLHEPLFRDSERLKEALYEVIQMLAQNAIATQTQNARQSADAKELDREPMQTLLASFAWPIKDALTNLVKALKSYRNEDSLDVQIQGIDEFDATLDDLKAHLEDQSGQPGAEENDEEADPEDKGEADNSNSGPRALRESKGVGLRDLSRRSGVSPGNISDIEAGNRNPGPQIIGKLASALGVSESAYQAAVDAVYRK